MIENFLKLSRGFGAVVCGKIGFSADLNRKKTHVCWKIKYAAQIHRSGHLQFAQCGSGIFFGERGGGSDRRYSVGLNNGGLRILLVETLCEGLRAHRIAGLSFCESSQKTDRLAAG